MEDKMKVRIKSRLKYLRELYKKCYKNFQAAQLDDNSKMADVFSNQLFLLSSEIDFLESVSLHISYLCSPFRYTSD